jgi:hypothetical protein
LIRKDFGRLDPDLEGQKEPQNYKKSEETLSFEVLDVFEG